MSADEYVRQLTAELRAQRERHEAAISAPRPIAGGRKLTSVEILQHLAVAKRSRELFHPDEPDVRIPAELVDIIAISLVGRSGWLKALRDLKQHNAARKPKVARRRAELRAEADKVRARNPSLSDVRVAAILAKTMGGSVRAIRRHIAKTR
jgi:hypothetical protein